MNYSSWLIYATNKLSKLQYGRRDAEILLQHVTKKNIAYILAFSEINLTEKEKKILNIFLRRRCDGEPIAYILKKKEFWSFILNVSPVTIIPRFDTEFLVEVALKFLSNDKFFKILDLGTGTGAIALALAVEFSNSFIFGIDIKNSIISLARYNAKKLKINNVEFYKSNWFDSVFPQKFDMIISNPPYIGKKELFLMNKEVKFEPKSALLSKQDGLADIKFIINHSRDFLKNNGWLILEHGFLQAEKVRNFFIDFFYKEVLTFKDYNGFDRVSIGRWKG